MKMQPRTAPATAAGLAVLGLVVAACGGSPAPSSRKTITVTVTPSQSGTQPAQGGSPTPSPGLSSGSSSAAGCLSRYLYGSTGLSQGTAGSVYVSIVFKNLDNVPCTLYGFPGVALAAGTPVTDIGQPSAESSASTRELVTLQPGGHAFATLQIADAGNFPAARCKPKASTWLEVIPPNQQIALNIPYKTTACQGTVRLLTVTAVRPGTGG